MVQLRHVDSAVASTTATLVATVVVVRVDRTDTAAWRNRLLAMPCQSRAVNVKQAWVLLLLLLLLPVLVPLPLLLHLDPVALSSCCNALLLLPQSYEQIPEKWGVAAAPTSASMAVVTEVLDIHCRLEKEHQGPLK